MVCVPCFIIPVLLFVWHRFIQPIVLRYWNPWAVKDEHGNVVENKTPEFPFQCAGGQCPFPMKKKLDASDNQTDKVEASGNTEETVQNNTNTSEESIEKSVENKKID